MRLQKELLKLFTIALNLRFFPTGETFEFGDLEIHPFSIQHDTIDPVAFTIRTETLKLGFCTDLGFVTSLVQTQLMNCDYLYVEANHQPSMVYASSRPMIYKQRVLSRSGHLSNEACGNLLAHVLTLNSNMSTSPIFPASATAQKQHSRL